MDYTSQKYQMSEALAATRSHPFGRKAFSSAESAHEIVEKAHRKGISYKKLASKAQIIHNIEGSTKAGEAARIARQLGHEHKEYKEDRQRSR